MPVYPNAAGEIALNILADKMIAEVFVDDARGEGADAVTAVFGGVCANCSGASLFAESGAAVSINAQAFVVADARLKSDDDDAVAPTKPMRRNILFLQCDEMDGRVLDPSHPLSKVTKMPHLRKLAARGVNFVRGYCENPLCAPSRAGMHTAGLHQLWVGKSRLNRKTKKQQHAVGIRTGSM